MLLAGFAASLNLQKPRIAAPIVLTSERGYRSGSPSGIGVCYCQDQCEHRNLWSIECEWSVNDGWIPGVIEGSIVLTDEVVLRVGARGTSSSLLSRNSDSLIRCKSLRTNSLRGCGDGRCPGH